MKLRDIIEPLEQLAPPAHQESYDNSGLIVGDPDTEIKGVLLCLDSTEAIVEEAMAKKCNLIIAHHPIVFKGLKRFNGRNYVEKTVIKALRNDICIYAIHTNLDNAYHQGVNTKIAEMLGLQNTKILAPKEGMLKMEAYVAAEKSETLRRLLFEVGAGKLNHFEEISFATIGVGTKNKATGGQLKLEVIFDSIFKNKIIHLLESNFSVSEIVYHIFAIDNANVTVGAGMVGDLPKAMKPMTFLKKLKEIMKVGCVKYTDLLANDIKTVAVCGGAGGFLLNHAIAAKADIFITSDFKYHEFFDADGKIIIADIGHFESEQYTIELLYEILSKKFPTFAFHLTEVVTNPVKYL